MSNPFNEARELAQVPPNPTGVWRQFATWCDHYAPLFDEAPRAALGANPYRACLRYAGGLDSLSVDRRLKAHVEMLARHFDHE